MPPVSGRPKRFMLATLMAILALNIWTGGPLLAIWIGSRVQGEGPPTMGAVVTVVVALGAISFALYQALQATSRAYDRAVGAAAGPRTPAPWLRSMRDERSNYPGVASQLSMAERILVIVVIAAFAAFEIWFFFFAGSSIGSG
jgi:hypothetical protein